MRSRSSSSAPRASATPSHVPPRATRTARSPLTSRSTRSIRLRGRAFTAAAVTLGAHAAVASASAAGDIVTIRPVAITGAAAPGTGGTFSSLLAPTIDADGRVLFEGTISPGGANGWWREDGAGMLELLLLEDDPVPGLPDTTIDPLGRLHLSAGSAIFRGRLEGAGAGFLDNDVVMRAAPAGGDGLSIVYREGATPEGLPAGVDSGAPSGAMPVDPSGAVVFRTPLLGSVDGTDNEALWRSSDTDVELLMRKGTPIPATTGDVRTGAVAIDSILQSRSGLVSAVMQLQGADVTFADNQGLFVLDPAGDGSRLALREGDVLDGAGGAPVGTIDAIEVSLNDAGDIAAVVKLTGAPSGADDAIVLGAAASTSILAREGDAAPGIDGATFSRVEYPLLLPDGRVAFAGEVVGPGINGTNDTGIWVGTPGALELFVRAGDPAPGLAGVLFDAVGRPTSTSSIPALDTDGRLTFLAGLDGSPAFQGLFAETGSGELVLVTAIGGSIEIAPGDERTVNSLSLAPLGPLSNAGHGAGQDGRRSFRTSDGDVVFRATFTDGSAGVLVATVPTDGSAGPDLDLDGDVDFNDLLLLLAAWGACPGGGDPCPADLDGNGSVDFLDLLAVLAAWS